MYFECICSLFPFQFFLDFSLLILLSTLCLSSPFSSSSPFFHFVQLVLPIRASVCEDTLENNSQSLRGCALWGKLTSHPVGVELQEPLLHPGTLTGLILCTFCTGNHRCGEFMSTMGLFVSRRHCFAKDLPELLLWPSFHLFFCEIAWALWGRFGIVIINDYYLLMMIAV